MRRRVRNVALAAMATLSLLATACGGGGGTGATPTGGATTTTGGGTQGSALTIEAVDNEFKPSTITGSPDQPLTVDNTGAALHNFSIKENGVDFDINPGESETEDAFEGLAAGEYQFFCKYHQSIGMEGTATISG